MAEAKEGLLASVPKERQLHVQFTNISGWVSTHVGPPSLLPKMSSLKSGLSSADKKEGPDFKQIMYKISGQCKPGEVVAYMGPSGSGKTSLLSILGGRTPGSVKTEGQVTFNGAPLTKKIKKQVGYVLQDDLLYQTLTVYETLYFAALLRLPSAMSVAEKCQRVETVITTLGLTRCRDTIVGGGFRRGVSGGERKRVSIGHELLINPSAIFLDEPTSGLDSTTAMTLLTTLRNLASGGRAVITTIHQPSSRLYTQLDQLLLLSQGHMMYFGRADMAADWFENLGYILPRGVNQAEFFLDLASGDVTAKKLDGEEARVHCIACAEKYLAEHPGGFASGKALTESDFGRELWNAAETQKNITLSASALPRNGEENIELSESSRPLQQEPEMSEADGGAYGASWGVQYMTLFRRALKVRRFEAFAIQDYFQSIVVAILAGLFFFQKGQTNTIYGAQNANGLIFFLMLFLAMRAMLGALFTFPPEFKMILKERASGMYKISAYYLARTTSDLPIDCTLPAVYVTILYWTGGLSFSARDFFETLFSVILVLLVAQSFGLLVGAVVPVPKTAQTLTTIVAMTMILVAGFFVTNIPAWISWLKYLSFVFYCYSLLIKIQYGHRDFYACGSSNVKKASQAAPGECTFVPSGKAVQEQLRTPRNPNEWPWEALVLIAFLIFMRVLVYMALRIKTRSKVK